MLAMYRILKIPSPMSTFGYPKPSLSAEKVSLQPFLSPADRVRRAAIFISGSGANAEAILHALQADPHPQLEIVALVTDRPTRSRTHEIGAAFGLPVIAQDIFEYYRSHGQRRVTLATAEGCEMRNRWTDALREQLVPLAIDFGIFAGFVPLCNIAGDFPCLNVHPGDLTVLRDAQRYLVGLHTTPIERAILADHDALRSSVIIAEPFTAGGDNMDSGPLLGISAPVPVHLQGAALCELRKIFEARPAIRPAKGYGDQLEAIADENLDRLKHGGDLLLFPRVVAEFAADRFALDECQALHYASEGTWRPVQTVVYHQDAKPRTIPR